MSPLVSIITLNWNRKDDVIKTLAGLSSQTYEPKEIIVVDNGSTDGSAEAIRKNFPAVKIIELKENTGVAGYNRGIEQSQGEFVMLVDNDMDLMQIGTLQKVVSYFEANPRLGAVALQVRLENQTDLSPNNPKHAPGRGNPESGYPASTFDGGGVVFRKAALDQVGLYTPEFFVYHSEVDLSTRLWDAAYEIRYFPDIAVSHRHSPTARNPKLTTYYSTRNYFWYVWIYYPFSMKVLETLHFSQMSLIQNLRRGHSFTAWLRGVWDAVIGWRRVRSSRKPVKPETLRWMQQLRVEDRIEKQRTGAEGPVSA
ncbi:MAG TPA: glycosyltransferase family 2 protein [Acidobacteriota bacterium]|nr:glycosyltransferase family 2 protein [Acidobacteriota bacterium]